MLKSGVTKTRGAPLVCVHTLFTSDVTREQAIAQRAIGVACTQPKIEDASFKRSVEDRQGVISIPNIEEDQNAVSTSEGVVGPPSFVTVVLPSVVIPEKRPLRLETIAKTWGKASRA
eukprot:scaffold25155_cov89-Skeletonema_dohrnii-CCMP3373.AAC.1